MTTSKPSRTSRRYQCSIRWSPAAQRAEGLILLCTSRWKLAGWGREHLPLEHASYGDFLQIAQELVVSGKMSRAFFRDYGKLSHVYDAFGGNCRGLEFFAGATLLMENAAEEEAFLNALRQTKEDLKANMAIGAIYQRLPEKAQRLLQRMPSFQEPVPLEGILKLGLDLDEEPEGLMEQLLEVSLVEAQEEREWDVVQFQCNPMVRDWLAERGLIDNSPAWLNAAADYHLYLLRYERKTVSQAITTHHALRRADRHDEADRLALDYIVGPLTRAGLYSTLLKDWLPRICVSEDQQTRGEALGQTGKLLLHIGDYETALTYLKQSLAIRQQIGDKAGLCATLFNMGHIHAQNEQIQEAVSAWVTVYLLARQMNLAQALQALANLAPQLGLPAGLEGWEMLARKMEEGAEEGK